MKQFLQKNRPAGQPFRLAQRVISIMILIFGLTALKAQAQTEPLADLDVSQISFSGKDVLTLICKANGQWFYYFDDRSVHTDFTGTITGTTSNGVPVIINHENNDPSIVATLNLDGLIYKGDSAAFMIWPQSQPVRIEAIGSSPSVLESTGVKGTLHNTAPTYTIKNYKPLILDGGTAGLTIAKTAPYDSPITSLSILADLTLQGKITLTAHNTAKPEMCSALSFNDGATLTCASDATLLTAVSGTDQAPLSSTGIISSPILQWSYETAPDAGQTLVIKNETKDTSLTLETDGVMKSFATNVPEKDRYTLRLDGIWQQAKNSTFASNFFTSENGLKTYIETQDQIVKNWFSWGNKADVGKDGKDVTLSTVSGRRTYTVKTACGLAWIANVTNGGYTSSATNYVYATHCPDEAGFRGCDIILANDISLAKPEGGNIATDFNDSWNSIGDTGHGFYGSFDGRGHTVSNLNIKKIDTEATCGLFGFIADALVKDLRVEGSINLTLGSMRDNYSIGGIAGYLENSSITGCSSAVAITLKGMSSTACVGGIAGKGFGMMNILNCWNEGKIDVKTSGSINAGGIVGNLTNMSGTPKAIISNCYATGAVESNTTGQGKSCGSAGIIADIEGYSDVLISNCYATGTISATSERRNAAAAGIVGRIMLSTAAITHCLALNVASGEAAGISATAGTGWKPYVGRILGELDVSSPVTLSDNYASARITLSGKVGETPATPALALGTDQKDGANLYLDEATDLISWVGADPAKAFTAIGTDIETGTLPQLKTITDYDTDGLPSAYGEVFAHQPAAALKSADYLGMPQALDLSKLSVTGPILISRSDGKWLYRIGDDATAPTIRFNGTISGQAAEGSDTYGIVITRSVDDNPTLTLADGTRISSNQHQRAALAVEGDAKLTIDIKGTVHLVSTENDGGMGFYNVGELTLTGDEKAYLAVDCKPGSDDRPTAALYNVNKLSVEPYSGKILLSAKAGISSPDNKVIVNGASATFSGGGWLEWQMSDPMDADTDYRVKGDTDDSAVEYLLPEGSNAFAMLVKGTDKSYTLWKGEIPQKGSSADNHWVKTFTSKENGMVAYIYVSDLKTIEIAGASDYSASNCAGNAVTVKPTGILTVDAANAALIDLTIEPGGQVVLTHPLQVTGDFKAPRTLHNKWIAFGSPIALTAKVADGKRLYTATGYESAAAADQRWHEISGPSGTTTADFAAAAPYLLSAEDADTPLDLTASGYPDVITLEADPVESLGESLGNGVFRFEANRTLQNQSLSGIYVLNDEGTQFVLHADEYLVKPFEAFIVANAVTRASLRSLTLGNGLPTGLDTAVLNEGIRVWGQRGVLHVHTDRAADVTVISPSGTLVRSFEAPAGDTATALPTGIYLVRFGNVTYKIVL